MDGDVELGRPFPELVGAFVDALSPIANLRSWRWGSVTEGEDAVVVAKPANAELAAVDVVRSSPSDPSFIAVEMDLHARFGDNSPQTIAHQCTVFLDDELVQGDGKGAYVRLVLHTDIFNSLTGGRVLDNAELAARNAPYVNEARSEASAALGVDLTVSESEGPDLADLQRQSLQAWASADSEVESAATRRVLRLGLNSDDLGRIYEPLHRGDELRSRYERYVSDLRRPWHPANDGELLEAGAQAMAELAGIGNRFGVDEWRRLSSLLSAEFAVVDRSECASSEGDLVSNGAYAFRSQLFGTPWSGSYARHYLAASAAVADGPLLCAYLMAPLLDGAEFLEGVYRLWAGGGSLAVRENSVAVHRMWQ